MLTNTFVTNKSVKQFQLEQYDDGGIVNQEIYYSSGKLGNSSDHNLLNQLEQEIIKLLETKELDKAERAQKNLELLHTETKKKEDSVQNKVEELSIFPKNPIISLLKKLPSNYPVNYVFVRGSAIEVSRFLNVSEDYTVAHFSNEENVQTFDISKIDGISWSWQDILMNNKVIDYN